MFTTTVVSTHTNGTESYQLPDRMDKLIDISHKMTKDELELAQVNHYQNASTKHPLLSFELIGKGDNPPDFLIKRGDKKVNLDVTSFSSNRWGDAARFKTLLDDVREAHRDGRLIGLKDIGFFVSFPDNKIPGDATLRKIAIPEFIHSLELIAKKPWVFEDCLKDFDKPGPGPFPMDQAGTTSDGKLSWYVTHAGVISWTNDFIAECGFSIEQSRCTNITLPEITERLDELVKSHDKISIEELVVVAGGPDNYGNGYVEEAKLALIFIEEGGKLTNPPQHLKRVVIYNWRRGTVDIIFEADSNVVPIEQSDVESSN